MGLGSPCAAGGQWPVRFALTHDRRRIVRVGRSDAAGGADVGRFSGGARAVTEAVARAVVNAVTRASARAVVEAVTRKVQ